MKKECLIDRIWCPLDGGRGWVLDEIRKFLGRCERQVSGIEKRHVWANVVFERTWSSDRQYRNSDFQRSILLLHTAASLVDKHGPENFAF